MKSKYHIIQNERELQQLIDACKQTKYASCDFETNGQPLYNSSFVPTILSVTFQPGTGVSIPLRHFEMPHNHPWKKWLIKFGREVIEDPDIVKMGWNWKFDNQIFVKYGIYARGTVIDAMLAKYILNENRPNGLKEMVKRYLPDFSNYEKALEDDDGNTKVQWDKIPLEELCKYGCLDTDCTFRLGIYFEKRLIDLNMYHILRNFYMPMSRVAQDMESKGLLLDRNFNVELLNSYKPKIDQALEDIYNLPKMQKLQKAYTQSRVNAYLESLQKEIDELDRDDPSNARKIATRENKIAQITAGVFTTKKEQELNRKINLGSPIDLPWVMYEAEKGFKFPVLKCSDKGKPSTDEETLTNLRLQITKSDSSKAIFLDRLLDYRALSKMYTTYIEGWHDKVQDDNCLHGRFLIHGTTSNRWASRDPNLQQVPKTSVDPNIKKQLIARPGTLYFDMDFSQCIDGESYIFCNTGIKKLKGVVPGRDKICLVDPQWVNHSRVLDITCLANKGMAECLKIVTNTGRELILTIDHPVKTVEGFTKAQDLREGDTLFIESFGYSKRCGSIHLSPDEAYIVGLFYGDGHYPHEKSGIRKEGDRSIAFATGTDREFFRPLLEKFFECKFNNPNKPSQGIMGFSDRVREFHEKYPKIDSHHMAIPKIILEADWETKMHFIGGQIDSDGSIGSGRFRYSSVCREYIQQLQLLFQSVGFHGIIRESQSKLNGKVFPSYHLIVQSSKAIHRLIKYLRLPRKIQRGRQCLYNKKNSTNPANKSSHCPTQRIPLEVYKGLEYPSTFYKTYKNSLRKGRLIHSTLGNYIDELVEIDSRWLDAYWFKFEQVISIEPVGKREVYDLGVDKLHEFNPNGIRVHNCELRVMAHLSKDETYLEAFAKNLDPHLMIASQKYHVPYEEAKRILDDDSHSEHKIWKIRRKQAKQIVFGLIYGIQAKLLSTKLSDPKEGIIVSPEEAQEMMNDYFAQHPKIKKFMAKQERLLRKQGYITSLFGTKRRLPEIYSEDNAEAAYAARLAVNFPVQSTASNITQFGAVLNYWNMKQGKFPPMLVLASVHDAYYHNTYPKYINVYTVWKMWDTFRNPQTKKYFGFQIDDVDMSMDFSIGRTMAEELPFIPGYDYNKMLQPDFDVDAYMEEHKKFRDIPIKEYPERFPELFKQGKQWKRLK